MAHGMDELTQDQLEHKFGKVIHTYGHVLIRMQEWAGGSTLIFTRHKKDSMGEMQDLSFETVFVDLVKQGE